MEGPGRGQVGLAHTGDAWRIPRLTVQFDSAKEGLRVVPAPTSPRDKGETHPVVSQFHSQEDVEMVYVAECTPELKAAVANMRRCTIKELAVLSINRRFLSRIQSRALEIVQNERRHRMGGN